MKVICAVLCITLAALIPAGYSQEGCTSSCCDYDYKASTETCCKYWVCANGVETELTCPGGLHWNDVSQACDWPASAGCDTTGIITPTTPTPPTPTTPTGSPGSPGTPGTSSTPGGCTGECECTTGTYDAIVGETCKYRVCDNGSWTTMSCAPGLIWDNTRKTCAWVECENC